MIKKYKQPSKYKKILVFASIAIGLGTFVVLVLEMTNTTYLLHDRKAVSGVIPSVSPSAPKHETPNKPDKNTSPPANPTQNPPESSKDGDAVKSNPVSGAAPVEPFGNFISNHTPNLDGDPAPSGMESVCNTSPGAECYMEFTNAEGIVKTLATQKTDTNGATYWNWDIKKAGLTVGAWKVKVTARLNSQTATTASAQDLEVRP